MAAKYTQFQREILTKIDALNQKINKSEGQYKTLEGSVKTLEEQQREYRNENMNKLDQVMGELAAIREDNAFGTYQIRELRTDVDGHEKRIKRIESRQ